MYQHIKVIAKPSIKHHGYMDAVVIEQTYHDYKFGAKGTFLHKGVLIHSGAYPRYYGRLGDKLTLYVQGSVEARRHEVLLIPNNAWPLIVAAIEAFNEKYKE